MTHVTLRVPNISCDHCARTIREALGRAAGVRAVEVDVPGKEVRVSYDEASVDVERLKAILREEDYPVASA